MRLLDGRKLSETKEEKPAGVAGGGWSEVAAAAELSIEERLINTCWLVLLAANWRAAGAEVSGR